MLHLILLNKFKKRLEWPKKYHHMIGSDRILQLLTHLNPHKTNRHKSQLVLASDI